MRSWQKDADSLSLRQYMRVRLCLLTSLLFVVVVVVTIYRL